MRYRAICILVFLFIYNIGFSQDIIQISNAKGSCIISNITPEQARETALTDAKNTALLEAGVSENVMAYSSMEVFSTNDTHLEYFSSLSNIVMNGQIITWEVLSERRYVNELDNFVFEVIIDAEVIKYETKPDPNFSAIVAGLMPVYYENDVLNFEILSSQDAYVYIFLLNNDESSQLYPNDYEKEQLFKQEEAYPFPINDAIDYTLTVEDEVADKNTLVFVLTKEKNTPLITDSKSLYKWLYSLEPEGVYYSFFPINILKK